MSPYSQMCDDFGIYAHVNTKMELPSNRETVLHFFDSVQKSFPSMTDFDCRDQNEYVLEEDREKGSYRWVGLDRKRFSTGFVNPPNVELADGQHERILEMAPYHLGIGSLDCESLDVMFSFEFLYSGNHDEVVAEALGVNSVLEPLMQVPGTKVLGYEPSLMLAMDESCRLQSRLQIETRTNAYQIRTNQFPEAPIAVYFTVRQYWTRQSKTLVEGYQHQRRVAVDMIDNHVIPAVLKPLSQTIENKR